MRRVKINDDVRIRFVDHVQNGDELMDAVVYGRVARVDAESIVVDCWALADAKPGRPRRLGDEIESFVIIKKAIRSIEVAERWTEVSR